MHWITQMVSRWIMTLLLIACASSGAAAANQASVKIALVQLNSAKVGDFGLMLADARSAKAAGAQMIVLPETADMGWLNPKAFFEAAPIPGEVTDKFAEIARIAGIWVVAGLAERGEQIASQPVT